MDVDTTVEPPREESPDIQHDGDYMDAEDRERFRRYRKRRPNISSFFVEDKKTSPTASVQREQRAAFILQNTSPEREPSGDGFVTPRVGHVVSHRMSNIGDTVGVYEHSAGLRTVPSLEEGKGRAYPVKLEHGPVVPTTMYRSVKEEQEEFADSSESSFDLFASNWDAVLQGFLSFSDLMRQYEATCRDLAESIREEAAEHHRITEDRLMRQKAQMLHAEAGSWALLWYLFGKGMEEMTFEDPIVYPSTSNQEACEFIMTDQVAQLCLRVVQWLEGLASKELDLEKKQKGWYAGSYMQRLGVWHQTQLAIRKKVDRGTLVQHLDPDAPTRERASLHPEDQKLEEGLLEDIWKLIRAGRLEEAQQLCRSAGQAWRAASLGGCGVIGPSPSVEAWRRNGKDRSLQALELDSGVAHQRRLWKWACFCASEAIAATGGGRYEAAVYAAQAGNVKRMLPICSDWESTCWALVKSWLDVQVDLELARLHPDSTQTQRLNRVPVELDIAAADDNMDVRAGPDRWPEPVLDQQPRDIFGIFQKLNSGDLVHENVHRSCKEQQRLVQMDLMVGDIAHLLDLLRSWILPFQDKSDNVKPYGNPQIIRFGAHMVLVLRSILTGEVKEACREKLWLIGDLILNTYAIFLFTRRREELVGAYASQLSPHLCVELYMHMMDLRQNDSVHVKYKIFRSAMEYLPFAGDASKGCVSDILDRFLKVSREIKRGLESVKMEDYVERQRLISMQKAQAVQWLCFAPPTNLPNSEQLRAELLARAIQHSNILFREFALNSLERTSKIPAGVHVLLSHLAEPLQQPTDILFSLENYNVQEQFEEFQDWKEYFAFDALYRNWLKVQDENQNVPDEVLSSEEKEREFSAAKQALDAALSLLQRCEDGGAFMWLHEESQDVLPVESIELHVTARLVSTSGPNLLPDATICTTLTSAFYSCVEESVSQQRQLVVDVSINSKDGSLVDVCLRCLPIEGDGIGLATHNDGGLLAEIVVVAVKGELPYFQSGVTLDVLRMDARRMNKDGVQGEAYYLAQGLCRRCCLPELILRCMQIRVTLSSAGIDSEDNASFLLTLIASGRDGLYSLFSQLQLQEFLLFEREVTLNSIEATETDA
ncbi:hypothetical protein O6H91_04G068600 [Diphasiastrum complanatum]|uniref:Uncharacterized protein n=2 Tax=Diphasiastrum complanatum TaxID=34168 RepID=A0ACC2DYA1_DIPCM|nr:hypothetical protein O6H91_04G068600 [Diphasiastrum complanatum]KAJ7559070.1 hypothetical protein O6H91_04G068600 [Diphasiastrum complanatum]